MSTSSRFPARRSARSLGVALAASVALAACTGTTATSPTVPSEPRGDVRVKTVEEPSVGGTPETERKDSASGPDSGPTAEPSDGRARDARLSIPKLGITDLEVKTYVGTTDDAEGHAIQNTGIVASPTGSDGGGIGPGGVGNFLVTGHRTSSTRIFEFLPDLVKGDRIEVVAGDTAYIYEVRTTRITSFRSEESLREQRAAVPGRPGVKATRAQITISTCRTQEDHAEGNFWADEFDNPENRIDKIGVLVRTRQA